MSHTGVQGRGPADRLCQQEFDGRGDKVRQHRERTASHHIRLPKVQHVSTRKKLHRRERPQATGDDSHEESSQRAAPPAEDVTRTTEIQCHHQVQTRTSDATG